MLLRSYTAILRNRNFMLLWGGQSISYLGDESFHVALLWTVVQLTGSPLALSFIFLALQIPWLALQPISGTLADRFNRQWIMLGSDLLRGVSMGVVAILMLSDKLALWHLYLLAFAFGALGAFFRPARSAILPSIVPTVELATANGLLMGTAQLIDIVGPALGGFLLAWTGPDVVGTLNALSFFVGALGIALMRIPQMLPASASVESRSFWHDFLDGLRYLRARWALLALLIIVGVLNFVSAPIGAFLPLFAQQVLEVGSEGFGLLLGGSSVGALSGSLLAGVAPHHNRGKLLLILVTLTGLFWLLCFGLAQNIWVVIGLLGLGGLTSSMGYILFTSILQGATAPEYRGRVASISFLLVGGLQPLAFGLMGGLAEWLGFLTVLKASCLLIVGLGMLGLLSKGLRQL